MPQDLTEVVEVLYGFHGQSSIHQVSLQETKPTDDERCPPRSPNGGWGLNKWTLKKSFPAKQLNTKWT